MHIWIDIDNPKHVPFYKLLTSELKHRGHETIVTAQDSREVKKALEEHKFNVQIIGKFISLFGLLEHQSATWRSNKLYYFLISKKIDIAFSLGSSFISSYNCYYLKIPIIVFLSNENKKINWAYINSNKVFFIVHNASAEKLLLENGIAKKKIITCNFFQEIANPGFKAIEELCSSIETLSNFRDISA